MGILDVFSDNNEKQAANTVKKGYNQGYNVATKALDKGFTGLKKNYAQALNQISNAEGRATGAITEGRDSSLAEFQPYADAAAPAAGMYSDAIGLNGAGGNAKAVSAFQTGPGYDFAMEQGLTALDRRAASRGMLASGNNSIDTINYSQGLANQEYGSWLDRLRGQQEFGAGIAGARAGIISNAATDIGDLNEASGTRRAAIKTGLGDVRMGYSEKLADLGYATRLGVAGVKGQYLAGKDQGGMNAAGVVTGGITGGVKALGGQSLGAKLLEQA